MATLFTPAAQSSLPSRRDPRCWPPSAHTDGIALYAVASSLSTLRAAVCGLLTLGLWVIGSFNTDLRNFQQVVDSRAAALMARWIYYLLPNFSAFDVKTQVVHGLPVPWSYVGLTTLYGVTYITLLLVAAAVVFSKRDFR